MIPSNKIAFAVRCVATLTAGLALNACVVRAQGGVAPMTYSVRPAATATVQTAPTYATVQTQPTYVQQQPTYVQQQPTYVQQQPQTVVVQQPQYSAPPPVVGVNAGVGVGVGGMGIGVGAAVGGGWTTNGYAEGDFVTYHMSLRARQFAAGFYPITQLYRAVAQQGEHQFVQVTAAPGRCYRIIGVGGPGVRDLDLRLRDTSGNIVDQDVATDNFPVLGLNRPLCLNWTGTFQVEVIMYSGGGEFGVQAFAQ